MGTKLDVELPRGLDVPAMAAKAQKIAAIFRLQDVRGYVASPAGIPIELDEAGDMAFVHLPERNLFIGGIPGRRQVERAPPSRPARRSTRPKMSASTWSTASASSSPSGPTWADGFARTGAEAVALLEGLVDTMEERYALLERRRLRKVTPDLGPT